MHVRMYRETVPGPKKIGNPVRREGGACPLIQSAGSALGTVEGESLNGNFF